MVFYLVLFQIPIPFIGDNVAHLLQKKYADQAKFINNLQIRGVSIAWNYEINRPIILIKNITYTSGDTVTKLDKIGFYPNISNSIRKKSFLIEKVYVEGLHIFISQDMQKHINVKLNNISNINTNEKKEDPKHPLSLGKRFNITHAYNDIKNIKRMAPVLAYLNEFSISQSDIVFVNQNKQSISFNVESLDVKDLKNIHIDIKSTLKINSSFSRSATITGSFVLNSKEEVINRLTIKDLSLEDLMNFSTGLLNKELLKKLHVKGFIAKIDMKSIYNLNSGFKDIQGDLHIGAGTVSYEERLTRNLEIDKMQMNLGYNKANGDLDFSNLIVNFRKNNHLELKRIGANILLSELSMNAKLNLKTKQLLVVRSFFLGNSQKINFSAKYSYADANKRLLNFSSNIGKMSLQNLKSLWPTKISLDVREWFESNVLKADVNSIKFNLSASLTNNATNIENVSSEILFNNVELTYLEGLPTVKSDNVKLTSSDSDIVITFDEATSEQLHTTKGLVKIYDYSFEGGYQPGVYVDLDIDKTNIPDVLNYIDKKPLELLHGMDINIAELSGTAQGNITLLYAIDADKLVDFTGKVVANDVGFNNVFQNQSLKNGNLDVSIGKDFIIFNGKAMYLETPANLDIRYSWGSGKTVAKYVINFDRLAIDKLYQLNLVDEKILKQFKGLTDLTINYKEYEKVASANIQADLKQAEWNLKEFNYTKPVGTPLFLNTQISLDDSKLVGIDRLSLNNNDINIVLGVTKNKESIAMKVARLFIRNKADARVNFLWQKDSTNIFVRGKFLDITGFIDDFKAGDSSKNTPSNKKSKSTKLNPITFGDSNKGVFNYQKNTGELLKSHALDYQTSNNSYNINLIANEVPISNQTNADSSSTDSSSTDGEKNENAQAVNDNTITNNNENSKVENSKVESNNNKDSTSTSTSTTKEKPINELGKDEGLKDSTINSMNNQPNLPSASSSLHVASSEDKKASQPSKEEDSSKTTQDINSSTSSSSLPNSKVDSTQNKNQSNLSKSSNSSNSSIDKIAVSSKPLQNYKIDLTLQSIRSHKITFANPNINLIILNNILDYMDFSYFEGTNKSYIFYNSKEKGLLMEVNNVGNLLQFLDVKARIKNGFLQVKATVEKILDSATKREVFVAKGKAVLNDFSLYLALGFSSVTIDFDSKGYYFNLKNIELTGNLMGGHLSGYLDYNKKYLDVTGKLIPIWSANHLISNAPIIRQLLGNNKEGNNNSLLQINMAIKGPLDKLDYSIFSKGGKKGEVVNSLNNDEIMNSIDENNKTKVKPTATEPTNLNSKQQGAEESTNNNLNSTSNSEFSDKNNEGIIDSKNSETTNEDSNNSGGIQPQTSSSPEPTANQQEDVTKIPQSNDATVTDTNTKESPSAKDSNTKSNNESNNLKNSTTTTKAENTEKPTAEPSKAEDSNKDSTTKSNADASNNKKKAEEGLNLQDLLK